MWVYTRADLAAARQLAGARHRHLAADAQRATSGMKGVLAAVGLPAAILLHSITAWIFGLQIARGFWYSAIMAPLFITSALVSGTGLMILLALVVRRIGRVSFHDDLVALPGRAAGGVRRRRGASSCSARCSPRRTRGAAFEADPARRLLTGRYAGFFWFEIVVGLAGAVRPAAVRALRCERALGGGRVGARGGGHLHPPAQHRPQRALVRDRALSARASPSGRRSRWAPTSFALSYFYYPAAIEYLVAGGVICFGALVFTLAAGGCRSGRAARAGAGRRVVSLPPARGALERMRHCRRDQRHGRLAP